MLFSLGLLLLQYMQKQKSEITSNIAKKRAYEKDFAEDIARSKYFL